MSVRIDQLQAGVVALLRTLQPSATVLWEPSEFPRAAAQELILSVRLLFGPDADPLGGASQTPATLPTAMTLQVTGAVVGNYVRLTISNLHYEYAVQAGDTIETVRDGLLAVIGPTPLLSVSFVPSGTDSITITGAVGEIFNCRVAGSATLTIDTEVDAIVSSADVESTIEIQAMSANRYHRSGAVGALSTIRSQLRLPSVVELLDSYGLSLHGSPGRIVNLAGMAGPRWESRAALDLRIGQVSVAVEALEPIETVGGILTVPHDGTLYTIPFETELP